MNLPRVRKLAEEGRIDLPKKAFKRFTRAQCHVNGLAPFIADARVVAEDVFNAPDFTFQLRLPGAPACGDLVCVQPNDGRTLRIVGRIRRPPPTSPEGD